MTSNPLRIALVAAATFLLLLGATGCAAAGASSSDARGEVALLRVDAPLKEPAWVRPEGVLLALDADEPRVVRVDASAEAPVGERGPRAVAASTRLKGLGENLAPYLREPEQAYVPQPEAGRITVLGTDDLRVEGSLEVGGAPAETAVQTGSDTLFALSRDGATVTAFDLENRRALGEVAVETGEGAILEAPEKGSNPSFWLADRDGVSFYHGSPTPIRRLTGERISAGDIAVDPESAQRVYVAEAGSDSVVALEGDPQGLLEGELLRVAQRDLGARPEHVGAEETKVYAATGDNLVVMGRERLEVQETVDFGRSLEASEDETLRDAAVSGMAVGEENVYLTLEGAPYVLSIDKP